jgi:hypothetical protein
MPWVPELFTAPVLQELLDKRRREKLVAVPYFDGLLSGEPDALLESFAGVPEVHDPVRGRVRGAPAFRAFAAETREWLMRHHVSVEDVEHVVLGHRGFEEVVLHVDGEAGPLALGFVIVADREADGRIDELRLYYSNWPLAGRHANRPPLLQPDPELQEPDVVAEHRRALATGIELEHCTLIDDGHVCALEYNIVRRGEQYLPPQAGVAVYVRDTSGKLATARLYDDADPPLGQLPAL